MAGWKDFREVAAWLAPSEVKAARRLDRVEGQHAEQLKTRVYAFLDRPIVRRKFSYCDDIARAARSGPSNIADGFGRFGNKEFANFASIAKASQVEVLDHLIDARDQLEPLARLRSASALASYGEVRRSGRWPRRRKPLGTLEPGHR